MLYKDKKIVHGRNLNYIRIAILILYTIFVMAFSVYSLSSPNYFLSLLLILLIILFVLFINKGIIAANNEVEKQLIKIV